MEDVIEQMKRIQSRIGSVIDNSNQQNQPVSKGNEIVGGNGIEVNTDGNKASISKSSSDEIGATGATGASGIAGSTGATGPQGATGAGINLPSGTGVLGINNGVLFVYETVDCE